MEIPQQESCPRGQALERWQDLVWDIDYCAGYEFAVMAGLAAPFMHLVTRDCFVINFFGGDADQRERLLRLALSCWTEPEKMSDSVTNISWRDGRTEFGFSYTLHAEKFSVKELKRAASYGATRMAIVCGEEPLDEEVFLDESIGGEKVFVLNLDVDSLNIEGDLGVRAATNAGMLTELAQSFAGDFLIKWMRETASCLSNRQVD